MPLSRLLAKCKSALRAPARFVLRPFRRKVSLRPFVSGAQPRRDPAGRILLVLNHAIRERHLFESIRRQIGELAPGVTVEIVDYRDPLFLKTAVEFSPDVVLTFPFTALTIADNFYPLKFLTDCRIVTYRAEGGLLDYSGVMVDNTFFVGYDQYGPELVDRELFWGRKMAQYAVPLLVAQRKLSSPDRFAAVGYPEYESYFDAAGYAPPPLPPEVEATLGRYSRERTALLITGFHASLYTRDEILKAKDWFDPDAPDAAEKLQWALGEVEKATRFKQLWIKKTLESAKANPEVLHVLKCHPLESLIQQRQGHDAYAALNGHPNILYVQHVPVRQLLERCGFFLHYGSTTLAESIILRIPSAFVYSAEIYPRRPESDFAKFSSTTIDIVALPQVIAQRMHSPMRFELTAEMRQILFDVFNITGAQLDGREKYRPSRDIASVLVAALKEPLQRIAPEDPYLARGILLKAPFFGLPVHEGRVRDVLRQIGQRRDSALARGEQHV